MTYELGTHSQRNKQIEASETGLFLSCNMLTPENKYACLSFLYSYREGFDSFVNKYVTWGATCDGLEQIMAPQTPQQMLSEFEKAFYIETEGAGREMKIKLTDKGKAEYLRLAAIENKKDDRPFREKYWWLIGIGGLLFGILAPGLSDLAKKYILQLPTEQTTILKVDTIEKTDTVLLLRTDTLYLPDSLLTK